MARSESDASASPEARDQLGFYFPEAVAKPAVEAAPAQRRIFSVGELVNLVRGHVERDFASVWIEGEISNLRSAPSGHVYFTLKDGDSQLPVVLFRRQALLLRFRPEDGLHALVRGKVSVYEQRGQMQLIAETMEPIGAGSLQIAFEQLKSKLAAEGLFSSDRKRPLPAFPRCVGIITSPAGAVIRDFLNITARRHAALDILLYPALVQGDGAAPDLIAGIRHFNKARTVDVIVLARGGGSPEDLACFNHEGLARAIAASELPVVSAVGHETDFTIADFVSDLRAPTPSAAAELITSAQHRVEERVAELALRLQRASRYQLMLASERLARVSIAASAARLRQTLGRKQQRVDELHFRLEAAWQRRTGALGQRLDAARSRLLRQDPSHRLREQRDLLTRLDALLCRAASLHVAQKSTQLRESRAHLQMLSPLAVLGRGYAVVFGENGKIIRDAGETRPGETIRTRLSSSSITSTVTETRGE